MREMQSTLPTRVVDPGNRPDVALIIYVLFWQDVRLGPLACENRRSLSYLSWEHLAWSSNAFREKKPHAKARGGKPTQNSRIIFVAHISVSREDPSALIANIFARFDFPPNLSCPRQSSARHSRRRGAASATLNIIFVLQPRCSVVASLLRALAARPLASCTKRNERERSGVSDTGGCEVGW